MIEFDLGYNGGPQRFDNIDDLSNWIEQQRASWEWIQVARDKVHHLKALWQLVVNRFDGIRNNISHAQSTGESSKAVSDIANLYGPTKFPVADTSQGRFLIRLKDEDPIAAAYALWSILGTNEDAIGLRVLAVRGAFLAMAHEFGISRDHLVPHQQAFDAFLERSQNKRLELENSYKLAIEGVNAARESSSDALVAQEHAFDDFMKASQSRFEELERAFEEHVKLKSSVTYWEEKAKRHESHVSALSWIVPVGGVTGVSFVVAMAAFLATRMHLGESSSDRSVILPDWLHSPWFAALLAIAVGVFWGVRILVRMLLSHVHLMEDALERVTLAKTYQAMISEPAKVTDDERKIIITQLFRHAATGVVKDDAAPAHPIEIITRPNN